MRVLSRKLVGSRSVVLAMALSSVLAMVGCASDSSSTGSNITAPPTFSPGAGMYTISKTVTIGDATPGAVLYCTTDGTTPTTSSPQCAQPTTVFQTEFLQALAVAPGKSASAVASAGYVINYNTVPTPTFSPVGSTIVSGQQITISDTLSGANVYYTTDGTKPVVDTSNTKLFTSPIALTQNTTLTAIAVAAGYTDSGVASATYTIEIPPVIGSISPTNTNASGPQFTLTVNGTSFLSGATILWNGTALMTTYVNATQLTAIVPASLIANAGAVNVTVAQTTGVSLVAAFTVNSVTPTVSALSPSTGSAGTTVTLTGTHFTGTTAVNFGSTPATGVVVNSDTSITAVVPAGTGTVDVTVVTQYGTSPTVIADRFAYPSTTVISVMPATGPSAGGTTVTIVGTHFTGATAVDFGSTLATGIVVNSDSSITAVSPVGTGTVDVTVITPNGPSGATSADQFVYVTPHPTLTGITPVLGPSAGGTSVTITGTHFTGATAVKFGSTPGTGVVVNSDTSITVVSPAGTGTVDVTVVTPGGTSATAIDDEFTYGGATLTGKVMSSTLPIGGATVQLYVAGTTGYAAGSSALGTVPATVTTASDGTFTLKYGCPESGAPADQMYLVATGGASGSNGANTSITLMNALGACSKLPSSVMVNEVTTVASAYALSAFATINGSGGITIGAPATGSNCNAANGWQSLQHDTCNYTGLVNAFKAVNNLVDNTGTALTHTPDYPADLAGDPNILNNSTVPTTRINALADMLASCVESTSSNCSSGLFTAAKTTGVTPADTLQAALNIAQNPGNNVSNLLGLVSAMSTPLPYSITSPDAGSSPLVLSGTGAPVDLTLALTFTGGGLGMSPSLLFSLSDNSFGVQNGALAIDANGNVWVGGGIYSSNIFSTNASMLAEFNALGAPITKATTLSGLTPTYGGFDPEPTLDQPLRNHGIRYLVIDQSGNLWTDDDQSSLLEISPGLSVLNTIQESADPIGLTIDSTGNNVWFFHGSSPATVSEVLGNGNTGTAGAAQSGFSVGNYLSFDSGGGMWSGGSNSFGNFDLFQLSLSDGSLVYDAFPLNNPNPTWPETFVADGSGNVYACDPAGMNMDTFNASASTAPANLMTATFPISTQRSCGTQLVLDGQGHLFSVLNNGGGGFPNFNFIANIDEFTTGGTLVSPQQNGYIGSSSTEAPTLNPDTGFLTAAAPGVSAAMDGSGNLWVVNLDTFGPSTPGNALVEYIGIGAPVVTPAASAQANGLMGVRP